MQNNMKNQHNNNDNETQSQYLDVFLQSNTPFIADSKNNPIEPSTILDNISIVSMCSLQKSQQEIK